jgi:hypothetical protein
LDGVGVVGAARLLRRQLVGALVVRVGALVRLERAEQVRFGGRARRGAQAAAEGAALRAAVQRFEGLVGGAQAGGEGFATAFVGGRRRRRLR